MTGLDEQVGHVVGYGGFYILACRQVKSSLIVCLGKVIAVQMFVARRTVLQAFRLGGLVGCGVDGRSVTVDSFLPLFRFGLLVGTAHLCYPRLAKDRVQVEDEDGKEKQEPFHMVCCL